MKHSVLERNACLAGAVLRQKAKKKKKHFDSRGEAWKYAFSNLKTSKKCSLPKSA